MSAVPPASTRVKRGGGTRVRKLPSDEPPSEDDHTPKRNKPGIAATVSSSGRRPPMLHELSVNILTLPPRSDGAVQLVETVILPGLVRQDLKMLRLDTFWSQVTERMPHVGPRTHTLIAPVDHESTQRWRFIASSTQSQELLFSGTEDGLKLHGRTKLVQVHILQLSDVEEKSRALTNEKISQLRARALQTDTVATDAMISELATSLWSSHDVFFINPPSQWYEYRLFLFMQCVVAEPQILAIPDVMSTWGIEMSRLHRDDANSDNHSINRAAFCAQKNFVQSFLRCARHCWLVLATQQQPLNHPLLACPYNWNDGFELGEWMEYLTCAVARRQQPGLHTSNAIVIDNAISFIMTNISCCIEHQEAHGSDVLSTLTCKDLLEKAICMQTLPLAGAWYDFWQGTFMPWIFSTNGCKELHKSNTEVHTLTKPFLVDEDVADTACALVASLLINSPTHREWTKRVSSVVRSLNYICVAVGWKSVMEVFEFFFRNEPFFLALAMNVECGKELRNQFNSSGHTSLHSDADAFRNPADKLEEDADQLAPEASSTLPDSQPILVHPWTLRWLQAIDRVVQRSGSDLRNTSTLGVRLLECAVVLSTHTSWAHARGEYASSFPKRAPHLASYWQYRALRPDASPDTPGSCTCLTTDESASLMTNRGDAVRRTMGSYRSSMLISVAQQLHCFSETLDVLLCGLSHRCHAELCLRRIDSQCVVKFDITEDVRQAAGLRDTYMVKLILAAIPAWYRTLERIEETSLPCTTVPRRDMDAVLVRHSYLINTYLRLYPAAWHLDWDFLNAVPQVAAILGWNVKQTALDNRFVHLTRQGLLEPRPQLFRQFVDAWRWRCANRPHHRTPVVPSRIPLEGGGDGNNMVLLDDEEDLPLRPPPPLRRNDRAASVEQESATVLGVEEGFLELDYPQLPPQRAVAIRRNASPHKILITRDSLIDSSTAALMDLTFLNIQSGFEMCFHGSFEDGEGFGVLQEWMSLLSEHIFTQSDCWLPSEYDSRTFVFNHLQPNPVIFALAGKIHALALLTRTKLKYSLASHLLRFAMTGTCDWHDLRFLNQVHYRSIKSLADMEDVSVTGLTFVIPAERADEEDLELKPGGTDQEVTNENRQEFAELYARTIMIDKHLTSLQTFTKAFGALVNIKTFPHNLFSNHDLVRVWCGESVTDIALLRHKTEYTEFDPDNDLCVAWFWEVFQDMSEGDRQKILFFTTSSSQVMLQAKPVFRLHRACKDDQMRPIGQTCFRTLVLPEYSSKKVLQEHLEWIVACPSRYLSFGNV